MYYTNIFLKEQQISIRNIVRMVGPQAGFINVETQKYTVSLYLGVSSTAYH
jgi:hypothetical protein